MGFDRMAVCVLAIGCWVTLVEDSSIALLLISGCSLKPPGMSSTDPRTTSCKSISARDSRFSDRRTGVGLAGSLEPLPAQFICHGTRRRVRDGHPYLCLRVIHRSAIGSDGSIPVLYADHETPFMISGKTRMAFTFLPTKSGGAAAIALWSHSNASVTWLIS